MTSSSESATELTAPERPRRYAGDPIGHSDRDQRITSAAEATLKGEHGNRLIRILPFLGPAFIASIAYMDPGNFATNIQGGAQFGYLLLWVIIASNIMAMVIQTLSAKLGIATGKNLPEIIRERFPKPVTRALWVEAEFVTMATDLAEFLGAAVALNLLFGLPMLPAGIVTAITTFAILGLQRRGFRPLEAVIAAFVAVIAICYLLETIIGQPNVGAATSSILQPRFQGAESVLLATGILGATVMPHVIYLHSALTQHRVVAQDNPQRKRLLRFEMIDIFIAMGIAGVINASMLMMAAAAFWATGYDVSADDIIFESHRRLTPLLGGSASVIFAISLLASGLASSAVGTMAGQAIMLGFLERSIPLWLRRSITMLPALIVIAIGVDTTRTLIISQVILSFGIPFALVPLVMFTSRRDLMGDLVNLRITTVIATGVATLIISLNAFLLYQTFLG